VPLAPLRSSSRGTEDAALPEPVSEAEPVVEPVGFPVAPLLRDRVD
jgi:hypothetical protein